MTGLAAIPLAEDNQQSLLSDLSRPFTTKKSFVRSCSASLYKIRRHIVPVRKGARPSLKVWADIACVGLRALDIIDGEGGNNGKITGRGGGE